MTAVEPDAPVPPSGVEPSPPRSLTGICPYLVAVDEGWRSSTVAREHRCRAVSPPAPLAAEKQRRLCLTADYPLCSTFEAARAARPVAHDRLPTLPRPLARTAPVVLDHGRLALTMPEIRADRLRKTRGLDDERIARLMAAQTPDAEKEGRSDYVIVNDGSIAELEAAADRTLAGIRADFGLDSSARNMKENDHA